MKRRSLQEILERARFELDRNPTITVYTMVDGREVRRPSDPWLAFRRSMRQIGQAFIAVKPDLTSFGESLQRALAAMPEPRVWPPGWGTPVTRPRAFSVVHSVFEPDPPARHPDLDVFDQALADYEAGLDADEEAGR